MNEAKIVKYISSAKSRTFLEIAKYFRIPPSNNREITSLLSVLQKDNKIFKNNNDEYYAVKFLESVEGVLSVNAKGMFGFVDYDIDLENNTKKSVFVKKFNFNTAMHNDTVRVNIYQNVFDDQMPCDGVITEVISRNTQEIQGFIKLKNDLTYFVPVDTKYRIFTWKIETCIVQIKLNDLVKAKITKIEGSCISIEIIKVITNEADPMVYVKYYLEEVKIPSSFPSSLEQEISLIPKNIDQEDRTNRRDLTNKMIVTIDGDDTKDFDDAIYVDKLPNGNYLLGVYIADVSYYVKENTEIDNEALKRGTSIYLVDQVVPMLPVELSNGICSLNPNQKRFVMACEMEIDQNGKNINFEIFEGIIESKFRLTYKQVDKYFKEGDICLDQSLDDVKTLTKMLDKARALSQIIHKFKINEGYVDFEINEPKIKLDENGSVKEIIICERGESEVLIEDFMVRANETIATFLFDNKLPALYRIHDAPDELKITSLKNSLSAIGIKDIKLDSNTISPLNFANFVNSIKTVRDDDFVKLMFLRTMQKAIYSNENVGHFGLASQNYCHFTSPIRRYPDLVIHRVIRDLVFNKQTYLIDHFKEKLLVYGDLNTKAEQKAVQTERYVNDLKFAEYLKNQTGKVYKGQILSILPFGFFIEFDFKASGLVHRSTLIDDEYEANENLTKLVGKKRSFTLGDYVNVVITNTDLVQGKVDCVLEDLYPQYLKLKEKKLQDSKTKKHDQKPKRKS